MAANDTHEADIKTVTAYYEIYNISTSVMVTISFKSDCCCNKLFTQCKESRFYHFLPVVTKQDQVFI